MASITGHFITLKITLVLQWTLKTVVNKLTVIEKSYRKRNVEVFQ